jgi:hypothetical protein
MTTPFTAFASQAFCGQAGLATAAAAAAGAGKTICSK